MAASRHQVKTAGRALRLIRKSRVISKSIATSFTKLPKSQRSKVARQVAKKVADTIKKQRLISKAMASIGGSLKKSRSHKKRSHKRRH